MRNSIKGLLAASLIATAPVYASGDHDHGHEAGGHSHTMLDANGANAMATQKLEELVSKGKLDKSWNGVAVANTEQKDFGKGNEWVVSFKNPAVADAAKQTLYIFFDASGHYLAANYTGQ